MQAEPPEEAGADSRRLLDARERERGYTRPENVGARRVAAVDDGVKLQGSPRMSGQLAHVSRALLRGFSSFSFPSSSSSSSSVLAARTALH
jgi:hypothetical protein